MVWIAATPRGICRVAFGGTPRALLPKLPRDIAWVAAAAPSHIASMLKKNASGKGARCSAPLDLARGTAFQRRVWRAIVRIPRGETRSYAWLARAAGRPRAIRAAANACGANPVPILIPCHRVIASDGSLGGFSGGLALKRRLLALEDYRSYRS